MEAEEVQIPQGPHDGDRGSVELPKLPDQHDFYKMPAKFGHVPVAEEPLGWDPKRRFEHLYPYVRLPLQVVERFEFGQPELEPNVLFFGDNLHVMRSLPSESIDLIYIDPPFFSQQNYNVLFGDQNELRSFKDIWDGGLNGYLVWLNARLYEMKRLLTPGGCIYVHVDWHASHYVKIELDKLFGYSNFLNEIAWCYSVGGKSRDRWARKHDTVLFYTRGGSKWFFDGKAAGVPRKTGKESQGGIIKTDQEGRLYQDKLVKATGKYYRYYLDEPKVPEDWWVDVNSIQSQSAERIGYPTQKPEALLERIIRASSRPGDIVADFCCGGGTTLAVAQRLGRRWIGCDISRVAVSITADRTARVIEQQQNEAKTSGQSIAVPDFHLANWGIYEIAGLSKMHDDQFREFVLAAFEARLESTGSVIHGYKGTEPIHVGSPDPEKPIHKEQVAEFANAVIKRRGSGGTGTMIAWAFTEAARKMAERIAAQQKVRLQFVKIRLLPLESPEFAAHVTSKAERYSDLLSFVLPPSIRCRHEQIGPRRYRFDVSESVALNSGARIVNVQWDFDYREYFTSTSGFELKRKKSGDPDLAVEYQFPASGKQHIAIRVQDDLGGEAIHRESLEVS